MAKEMATREAYGEILIELGKKNKDVVVLDADLSKSTKTAGFSKEFPERFFNMGIAEQNLMGTAAGLAVSGKVPFASTFAVFAAGRAFEIIRNSICYPKLNVKVCATHAGVTVGEDGASHQAIEDLGIMRTLPNMTVINPADGVSAKALIEMASEYYGPCYIRLGRSKVPNVYDDNATFEIGKANLLRDGKDVTIIANGILINEAMIASEELAKEGIDCRVIDMHTIKPLDNEIIVKASKETKGIVTAEEHNIIGGLGSAVAEVLAEEAPCRLKRVGVMDTFGESGKPAELMVKYGLTSKDIIKKVKELV